MMAKAQPLPYPIASVSNGLFLKCCPVDLRWTLPCGRRATTKVKHATLSGVTCTAEATAYARLEEASQKKLEHMRLARIEALAHQQKTDTEGSNSHDLILRDAIHHAASNQLLQTLPEALRVQIIRT